MNCQAIRNRILALETPNVLPDELAAHMEGCPNCAKWHRQFAIVEQSLSWLPVAESDGLTKIALLEKIRAPLAAPPINADEPMRPVAEVAPRRSRELLLSLTEDLPKRKHSFGSYAAKFWPAGLVAATLLIGTIAWLSLRGNRPPPSPSSLPDPMLDYLVELNVKLARTQVATERVKILAEVADKLNVEMRDIARADASGDNMRDLEEMYRKVVLNGLVSQAKLIDKSEREVVLGEIAVQLAQAGTYAESKAREAPEHSAKALREAAGAAREGTKRLRLLIQEASL